LTSDAKSGAYSHGDQVSLADLCLASQVVGAKLFGVQDFSVVPTVMGIFQNLMHLSAFEKALPMNQPGAPKAA
jgi:glutathione S-transferase